MTFSENGEVASGDSSLPNPQFLRNKYVSPVYSFTGGTYTETDTDRAQTELIEIHVGFPVT